MVVRGSAGQLASVRGCAVRPGTGPDMIGYCAAVLDHPLRLQVADRLAVGVAELVGGAAGAARSRSARPACGRPRRRPGCGSALAGSSAGGRSRRAAGLAGGPRSPAWKNANRSTAGPSLVIARLGWDTVPEDQVDGFNPT